jgi:hypothetical protein
MGSTSHDRLAQVASGVEQQLLDSGGGDTSFISHLSRVATTCGAHIFGQCRSSPWLSELTNDILFRPFADLGERAAPNAGVHLQRGRGDGESRLMWIEENP